MLRIPDFFCFEPDLSTPIAILLKAKKKIVKKTKRSISLRVMPYLLLFGFVKKND